MSVAIQRVEHSLGGIEEARSQLRSLLAELQNQTPAPGTPSGPIEPTESKLASLVVGKAEGKPGETVMVEILGGTQINVISFSIAIGCNPMLQLVGVEESQHLKTLLLIDDVEDINRQHRKGKNWSENWIQLYVGFYRQVWETIDPKSGEPVQREIIEVVIPSMMPLYNLKLKIPDNATPGMRLDLDCEQRYGHKLSSNGPVKFLEYPPNYGTHREVAQFGIRKKEIELVSGWIDVVG